MRFSFVANTSYLLGLSSILLAMPIALPASAQAPEPDRWTKLYLSNDLDLEASKPFHLKMTFQLFDLNAKPAETGTVEEWWYSPHDHRIVIASPSIHSDSSKSGDSVSADSRASYLVDHLLEIALRPVTKAGSSQVETSPRNFGKVTLDCSTVATAKTSGLLMPGMHWPTLCTPQGSDAVRVILRPDGFETVTRNSVGKFGDVFVAQDIGISFFEHDAISGKVVLLQGMVPKVEPDAPVTASDQTAAPHTDASGGVAARIAGGVIAGSRTKFVNPEFPGIAKANHMSGSVILRAIIGKDGKIRDVAPIATTDLVFTGAAVDAVKQWQYRPYLLNGEPTDVDTTITVNFAFK